MNVSPRVAAEKEKTPSARPVSSSASQKPKDSQGTSSTTTPRTEKHPTAAKPPTPAADLVTNPPVIGRAGGGKPKSVRASPSSGEKAPLHEAQPSRTPPPLPTYSRAGAAAAADGRSSSGSLSRHGGSQRPSPPPVNQCKHVDPSRQLSGSDLFVNIPDTADDDEEGIVTSSKLALARLSFEECVIAASALQDLMMAHAAAVTGAQTPQGTASVPHTQVNQITLSQRPLDEIADDLAKQLRKLCQAYESSSRAERQLMGVAAFPNPSPSPPPRGSAGGAGNHTYNTIHSTIREIGMAPGDTFGPMLSTQTANGADDFAGNLAPCLGGVVSVPSGAFYYNNDDSDRSRRPNDGLIDVGQANPGPHRSAYNTQFVYPDGTCVSFPISTFGELVQSTVKDAAEVEEVVRAAQARSTEKVKKSKGKRGSGDSVREPASQQKASSAVAATPSTATNDVFESVEMALAAKPAASTASKASAKTSNAPDQEFLNSYVRALESKLSEKQKLEALREARGSKTKGGKSSTSSLAHLAQSTSVNGPYAAAEKK